jgi:hypothetical protein
MATKAAHKGASKASPAKAQAKASATKSASAKSAAKPVSKTPTKTPAKPAAKPAAKPVAKPAAKSAAPKAAAVKTAPAKEKETAVAKTITKRIEQGIKVPMAKAAAAVKEEPREEGAQAPATPGDSPLLDSTNASVKKLIAKAKERGYITYDELNAALPSEEMTSEQIEDTMSMLSEMGINVVEGEEQEEPEAAEGEETPKAEAYAGGNIDEDDVGRTDDPVRMYLREMGSVELLSREGEIAIAKRIEAGREMMIGGICESPITIRSLLSWHDALQGGKMLLRDIIDLDATYGAGASDTS